MENIFDVILYSNGNIQFSNSYFAPTLANKQFMGNCGKICSAKQSAKVKQLRTKTSPVTKQASSGQSKETTAGWQEQEMTQKTPLPMGTKGAAQCMKADEGDDEMCTQAMGQGVLF